MSAEATAEVYAALRKRFDATRGEWGLLFEVGNATGHRCARHADAIAMSLWPGRGLFVHGIEVKSTRADWRREKKNPGKADPMIAHCDFWWLAAADDGVVLDGELPDTWGLMVLRGGKLVTVREAPKFDRNVENRDFLAAVFRAAQRSVPERETIAMVQQRVDAAKAAWDAGHAAEVQHLRDKAAEAQRILEDFRRETGLSLYWQQPEVREAFRLASALPVEKLRREVATLEKRLRDGADALAGLLTPTASSRGELEGEASGGVDQSTGHEGAG